MLPKDRHRFIFLLIFTATILFLSCSDQRPQDSKTKVSRIFLGTAISNDGYDFTAYTTTKSFGIEDGVSLALQNVRIRFFLESKKNNPYDIYLLKRSQANLNQKARKENVSPTGIGDFSGYNYFKYNRAVYANGSILLWEDSEHLKAVINATFTYGATGSIRTKEMRYDLLLIPRKVSPNENDLDQLLWKDIEGPNWKAFEELISELAKPKYQIHLIRNAFHTQFADDKVNVFLRHDIDNTIYGALRMAYLEAKANLKSTFYILMPAGYCGAMSRSGDYRFNYAVIQDLLKLQQLGHAVGYHNSALINHLAYNSPLLSSIRHKLSIMRRHGLTIDTSCPHGTKPYEETFFNKQLFDRKEPLILKKIMDGEETYSLPVINRNDFGIPIHASLGGKIIHYFLSDLRPGVEKLLESLRAIPKGKVVLINTHPVRWTTRQKN